MKIRLIYVIIGILAITGCNQESTTSSENVDTINIGINRDPQRINPFYAPTSLGREIFQYIFLPLADFHPDDLTLTPILINEIPEGQVDEENNLVNYTMEFKSEAQWSDGTPITANDYVFTIKAINHSLCKASAWKSYFKFFKDVKADENNDKRFTVSLDGDYMLSKELALTTCILPQHIYDAEGVLNTMSVTQIQGDTNAGEDSLQVQLFDKLNASVNDKSEIIQSGPYAISEYESQQYYILEKKENYWGMNSPEVKYLNAYADKLVFKIVPDEVTAISMARENNLDVLTLATSNTFKELMDDESFASNWTFHTPQVMLYYFILMNNDNGYLSDRLLRTAMSHIADVDDYIQNIDGGLGTRTIGHFNPVKSYYNDSLSPKPHDIEKAKSLLAEAGWTDSNNNGTVDKLINGQLEELSLDVLITGSPLSKNMALLFQESAKEAGVEITITQKTSALMRSENFATYNYDMAMTAVGQDAAPDDPYSRWHSDNARPGTQNNSGYNNPRSDELIEKIRTTTDENVRKEYYLQLQEEMYNDQPVIFLYSPLKKIIIRKTLDANTTAKRPGYLANTFKAAS